MTEDSVFHVRNAHPGDMVAVLSTIDTHPNLPTVGGVLERAEELGFAIRDRQRLEALATARDLGFVHPAQNRVTRRGKWISQLAFRKPELFSDVVHYFQYTLWDRAQPTAHCFSWTYRTLCELFWGSGHYPISDRRSLAAQLDAAARSVFNRDDIALSAKTVGGVLLWLAELVPAVLDHDQHLFIRRGFCAPELFVLALDEVFRSEVSEYGTNLLITEETRDRICQVCLLDPEAFDRVTGYAVAQFDYLEQGVGGGWGRYLLLKRKPKVEDFL